MGKTWVGGFMRVFAFIFLLNFILRASGGLGLFETRRRPAEMQFFRGRDEATKLTQLEHAQGCNH
jgi:hypothetical protein